MEETPVRNSEIEKGRPHTLAPMQLDKSTVVKFVNNTIKQRRSESIDMRFYWLQDRESQEQLKIYWRPDLQNPRLNHGGYHIKFFTKAHHILCRPIYFYDP